MAFWATVAIEIEKERMIYDEKWKVYIHINMRQYKDKIIYR